MRDEIAKIIVDSIYLEELQQKARKWDEVERIAGYEDKDCRDDHCPFLEFCRCNICVQALEVMEFVTALAGKEDGDEH